MLGRIKKTKEYIANQLKFEDYAPILGEYKKTTSYVGGNLFYILRYRPIALPNIVIFGNINGSIVSFSGCKRI